MGLIYASIAGATVQNSTTEATLVGTDAGSGTLTLLANQMASGGVLRVRCRGRLSTASSPGTLRVRFYMGATLLCSTAANTPAGSLLLQNFDVDIVVVFRSTGSGAVEMAHGTMMIQTSSTDGVPWQITQNNSVPTDANKTFDLTAQWGTADASNIITSDIFIVDQTAA